MQFSHRLDRFGDEVFAALNQRRLKLEAQGRTIYNLSVGTPDFAPYDHVVEALRDAAANPAEWKYSLGDLPELKQAVCDYYARRFGVEGITPDMVASCNGTQEGVGHLGLALLDPAMWPLFPIRATRVSSRRASRSPTASSRIIRSTPSMTFCPTSTASILRLPTARST